MVPVPVRIELKSRITIVRADNYIVHGSFFLAIFFLSLFPIILVIGRESKSKIYIF